MPVYIGITHTDAGSDPKSANTCAANQAITHHSLPLVDRREIAKGERPRRRDRTRSAMCLTRRTELDREGRSFDDTLEVVEDADTSRVSTRWAMRVLRGCRHTEVRARGRGHREGLAVREPARRG